MTAMGLFFSFLRQKKRTVLWALGSAVLFATTFLLFHLPMAAVLYPAILCLLIGIGLLLTDYFKMRKRHRLFQRLQCQAQTLIDALPPAEDILEADYQALFRRLDAQQREYAQKAAAEYADMLDYYTIWAHQIKTPIAAMRLRLQNEDSTFSRQLQPDLGRIEQYVDMVLTYLRLDSASTDYVFRECDLDAIVRSAVRKFSGEFIGRKLKLNYEPLHTKALTDEKWLSFIIEQVLSNALKYTPSGSISIYMEGMTLCVRDTGIGIAPEDLPRIFDRGYTGYTGRLDHRATGIGLYLCKRICKNLGHTITVHSQVGKGTVVRLDLTKKSLQAE